MADNIFSLQHQIDKPYIECSNRLADELHSQARPEAFKQRCAGLEVKSAETTPLLAQEKQEENGVEFVPFIAIAIGHGEVEPVRLGPEGIVEEPRETFIEPVHNAAPPRFPTELEGEGHVGLIIKY